jgi:hypothetical protein
MQRFHRFQLEKLPYYTFLRNRLKESIPEISALTHIREGNCAALGGVAHGLSDTSGATSSSVVDATLDSLLAGSFAVNRHTDGDAGVYSSCGDI